MGAQLAGREVKQRVQAGLERSVDELRKRELLTRVDQAKILVEHLGQLKGAVMKAGQLLSLDASDIMPPEVVDVLARLQSDAEPVDFAVMRGVLEEDLGAGWRDRFETFDEEPAASASIGQVHRGRVDGVDVAVKVQYPGIVESVDSDLAALQKMAGGFLRMSGRKVELDHTFRELARVLKLEADYEREAQSLARYGELVSADRRFVVPRPLPELSASRVLTMEWALGEPLHAWIRRSPSLHLRESFGRAALDLYCHEFFDWGFVQTDPNHGNYLMAPDGRIVLLDLGAALEFDDDFRRRYVALLRTIGGQRDEEIIEAGIEFDLLDPREGQDARDNFALLLKTALEPFRPDVQPFRFRNQDYAARARAIGRDFTLSLRFSPPPRKLLFLHRKLGGLFQLLKRLDLQLDLFPYWEKMVGTEIETSDQTDVGTGDVSRRAS